MRKKLDWSLRMTHELQSCGGKGAFLTLTYNQQNIPADAGLHKEHVQKFIRALRKRIKTRIRYFACGEYGEKGNRPHYHLCIFGYDFPDKELNPRLSGRGNKLYKSKLLTECWRLGDLDYQVIGDITQASAAYVAKYCQKKVTGEQAKEHYRRFDGETGESFVVQPEFQLQSVKPGIGHDWLIEYMDSVFPADHIVANGREFPVPEYYLKVLERERPELYERVREARKDARLYKSTVLDMDELARIENVKLLELERKLQEAII